MSSLASSLVAASAAIVLLLGLAHLLFTFRGPKLWPRDPELQARMKEVSPVITGQTTIWKCWVGFNASHSIALILFGVVYAYLALAHGEVLFHSVFLLSLGMLVLLGYGLLAKVYFFRTPFRGVILATVLYAVGLLLAQT